MNCRKAVAVFLLIFLALEILPCTYLDAPTLSADGQRALACSIEPLQVCGDGDSFLSVLVHFPVVVPGTPVIILSAEVRYFVPDGASFAPDGFHPAIDHPPQLSA